MKILVCGGRDFNDVRMLWRVLDLFTKATTVIDGASDDVTGPYVGADYWANQWAMARGKITIRQHARWREQGRAAGPIRNAEMLELYKPECVIAFPGGRGTANMIDCAMRARVRTYTVSHTGEMCLI